MLDPSVTKRSWRRWACFSTAQSCLQTMSQSGSRLRKTRRFCKVHAFMEKIGDALCYERDRPSIAPFEGNTADEMLFFSWLQHGFVEQSELCVTDLYCIIGHAEVFLYN